MLGHVLILGTGESHSKGFWSIISLPLPVAPEVGRHRGAFFNSSSVEVLEDKALCLLSKASKQHCPLVLQ